ncbi:GH3 auxin-responsive promoter family protein [Lewinella sp. IMCC34183]|uniref:GH3 auxin-responsive promoter family protein n=1 Tax=Lewinella sp. IMCC34183 TaxID=2248762 RepID=UPI000E232B63|nr:GH3 auxin-responsive promoter family protein [Lewinella sp. IMCC34183]
MPLRSSLLRPYASYVRRRLHRRAGLAVELQEEIRRELVRTARDTAYGRDHDFGAIRSYADYRERVPIGDYEDFRPYADRIKAGEADVSWPGRPRYLAKTSGTTSGVKYIPITRESLPNHFGSARNALFNYVGETGHARWLDGKMIFLSGSPEMGDTHGIPTGRLSGIVNHVVPAWLRTNQLPSYATNCIEDWETKLDAIVEETRTADLRLISGIPPWIQMYYERLLARTGKDTVREVFPNFEMFVYGGVNFEPYRQSLERLVGARIPSVETYPASEGFIAFQDSQTAPGLLLNTGSGIFFEFVPAAEVFDPSPTRLSLGQVQTGVNYAIVLSTTAGLWAYNIGDTVEFTSLTPHRIRVTGRIKHFISAFGEHVIGKEVETALRAVAARHAAQVTEFTVAPQVSPPDGLPYHEWLVEFGTPPADPVAFAADLDRAMVGENLYYRDLIDGRVLRPLVVTALPANAFRRYMKAQGKLGGQNKVPRLANDRQIADALPR